MTDAARPRPVPGPPRPQSGPPAGPRATPHEQAGAGHAPGADPTAGVGASPFADLAGRPVADHVAVFEAEHERLQRELSTIDQL